MASWTDESLFQRPPSEDRGCHRARNAQGSGRSHLRSRDLHTQTLRLQGPKRKVSGARQGSRQTQGCELLYLPSYSSDFNPIEEAFSKIKGMVRQAAARTREALVEVLGEALSAVSVQDAQGYFEHAGYCPRAQLL